MRKKAQFILIIPILFGCTSRVDSLRIKIDNQTPIPDNEIQIVEYLSLKSSHLSLGSGGSGNPWPTVYSGANTHWLKRRTYKPGNDNTWDLRKRTKFHLKVNRFLDRSIAFDLGQNYTCKGNIEILDNDISNMELVLVTKRILFDVAADSSETTYFEYIKNRCDGFFYKLESPMYTDEFKTIYRLDFTVDSLGNIFVADDSTKTPLLYYDLYVFLPANKDKYSETVWSMHGKDDWDMLTYNETRGVEQVCKPIYIKVTGF
ncbi:MAG: hypothetical protein JXB49_01800 [Bacteroidales bacterium]|nr:hypothetical protein [Bacteroidales bacterium]